MPERSAPRDPVPYEVAPLDAQLTGVLRATGAHAARAVDGRRAVVLAEVGLAAGDDVAALVQLAQAAGVLTAARGEGLDDLIVSTGRTVHVLRGCDQQPGVVLHVRMDRDSGDVGAARRALASRSIVQAVRAALTEPAAAPAPLVAVPLQRVSPSPVKRPVPPVSLPPVSLPPVSLPPVSLPPVPFKPVPRPRVSEPSVQQPSGSPQPEASPSTVSQPAVSPQQESPPVTAVSPAPSAPPQPASPMSEFASQPASQPAVPPQPESPPVSPAAVSPAPSAPPQPVSQPAEPPLSVPVQRPSEAGERQPALVTLTGKQRVARTGALAVLALPPVPDPAAEAEPEPAPVAEAPTAKRVVSLFDAGPTDTGQTDTGPTDIGTADAGAPLDSLDSLATGPLPLSLLPTLPRRRRAPIPVPAAPAAVAASRPAVLQQSFASDIDTMRRLLDGLRQLA